MPQTPNPAESVFCASLIALVELNKVLAPMILEATQNLAALRDTVKPLDPTFAETYARNRAKNRDTSPPIGELLQASDELLQALRDIQKQLPAI
jgi:hypothetical protein